MDPTGICEVFEDSIQLAPDDITFTLNPGEIDEPQEENKELLGRIISRYKLGKATIQGSLKLSWHAIKGWKWKEIEDGLLQFTFAHRNDAMNVLARRPCIPPFYWNLSNLKEMAAKASPIFELPQGIEDVVGMSTLRFRATIDLNSPIYAGFFLRRQKLKDLWIQYKYEKLPKLCFKCGLFTHDQSTCFKAPTVVKDDKGNFYPLFGIWLKKDAQEKSTFTTPLPKWFQDWVMRKRLGKDPILRNQVKIQKALRNGDEAEMRECRMQFPRNRRIISDSDEDSEAPMAEEVITQLPLVYLLGIGEFSPFGNNTKTVSVSDLIEATVEYAKNTSKNKALKRNKFEKNTNQSGATISIGSERENGQPLEEDDTDGVQTKASNIPNLVEQGEPSSFPQIVVSPECNEVAAGVYQQEDITSPSNPYKASPLGSQAQIIQWPSKELWAQPKARELLMGSLTIDKYHREPTLLNPITSIDEFRVQEHLQGPRKRKASDGFIVSPPTKTTINTEQCRNAEHMKLTTNTVQGEISTANCPSAQNPIQPIDKALFSPGCDLNNSSSKRRGRPRKQTPLPSVDDESQPKKRGRPPKTKNGLSATPKPFKWRKKSKPTSSMGATITNLWESKAFDLKVDLENHFVVIENTSSETARRRNLFRPPRTSVAPVWHVCSSP
ncbi:hypothetical protein F8388_011472 [Cannabis sativa]|uniref:Zinc knuckle CX2CX4HX4C domain-containing protein n=1 Tax=Cannabis sativa TaxID=3483 RepID=A0A7J6G6L8_CANSA|nr:hypothetical protein G4B88_007825 [Cannabis sativa]KAF4377719.1 hypothetical protein F8388_011472 [Cannabis sativa]